MEIVSVDQVSKFQQQVSDNIKALGEDYKLRRLTHSWMEQSNAHGYTYNFTWLGRPIIQYPQDMVAMQELIWSVRPDLIIETGIAHGGSLILSASMLAQLDLCDAIDNGRTIDPAVSGRKVLGIDIDVRAHNRTAIESHPMASRIQMIEGSSVDADVVSQVVQLAQAYSRVLVCLDSNHTEAHVLAELEAYAPLVSKGSYCVVFDSAIEDMPEDLFSDRPWGKGDNPKTALWKYLQGHDEFEIDKNIEDKLSITVAPDGFLRRIK